MVHDVRDEGFERGGISQDRQEIREVDPLTKGKDRPLTEYRYDRRKLTNFLREVWCP